MQAPKNWISELRLKSLQEEYFLDLGKTPVHLGQERTSSMTRMVRRHHPPVAFSSSLSNSEAEWSCSCRDLGFCLHHANLGDFIKELNARTWPLYSRTNPSRAASATIQINC
jgi:hypothetical protein